MIYVLIAGTYTPFALLVLRPGWRLPMLAIVWGGALVATATKVLWPNAPTWFAPGDLRRPRLGLRDRLPADRRRGSASAAALLLAAGGLAYTARRGRLRAAAARPVPATRSATTRSSTLS